MFVDEDSFANKELLDALVPTSSFTAEPLESSGPSAPAQQVPPEGAMNSDGQELEHKNAASDGAERLHPVTANDVKPAKQAPPAS